MAPTRLQRVIRGLLAKSQDIDVFHDTTAAVAAGWAADRGILEGAGYHVDVVRERPSFVEAHVSLAGESVLVQWAADSAYRFFPLVEHAEFGLVLHPCDLATNKVLALVGRVEARDWIDVIDSHSAIQPLGYLAWAAAGKDPGFSPSSLLDHASRTARYSTAEVDALAFEGPRPDAGQLSRRWRGMLDEARTIVGLLPGERAGCCVLAPGGALYLGTPAELRNDLAAGHVEFRQGSVRGVLPTVRGA